MLKKTLINQIRKNKSFLISSHVNLEGDALGSLLAMHELLRSLNKKVFVFCDDFPPKMYKFLIGPMKININPKDAPEYDAAIILDSPQPERIGKILSAINRSKPIINIDHHISNTNYADVNWVDSNASCVGEMIYQLYGKFGKKPNRYAAMGIYVAILTDTGSFRYENTTPSCLKTAGELLRFGIDPKEIAQKVYETKSYQETKLLGEVISTLKLTPDKKIAYFYLTQDMLRRTNAVLEDSERFINFGRSIEGVEVAIFLREKEKPNTTKISLRSKGKVDVNKIAQIFGGGGHRAASGCEIKEPLKEAMNMVLANIRKEIDKRQ
ncbi:MAG: bifunctional oligoribonuclease/PAP phosphatase NrnA [Candidatus Omnitrophota bacterium]